MIKSLTNGAKSLLAMAILSMMICPMRYCNAEPQYTMDHPAETHYYDLWYKNVTSREWHKLCTELAAEDRCEFEVDTAYIIDFELPEPVLHEIAEGSNNYQIDVAYDDRLAAGEMGYIWIRMFNPDNGQLYVAWSGFTAKEDMSAKHAVTMLPDGELTGFYPYNFTNNMTLQTADYRSVRFALLTSSGDSDATAFGDKMAAWEFHPIEAE